MSCKKIVSKIPDQNLILSLFFTLLPYKMLVGDHEMRVPKIICPEKLCVFLLIKIIPLKIEFIFLCNDVVKTPKNL
jgi:hypothetical protein